MKKKYEGRAPQRIQAKLILVMVVIMGLFALVLGRLLYWNLSKGHEFEKKVLIQQRHSSTELPFERGEIYDTNGKVLVTNERKYTLVLEPKNILMKNNDDTYKYKETTINALVEFMGLDKEKLEEDLYANENSYYLEYIEGLSYDEVADMKEFLEKAKEDSDKAETEEEKKQIKRAENVKGVLFVETFERVYPNGVTACHLLGFTSAGNVGQWGIEQYYNDELNGVNGRNFAYLDEELKMESTRIEPINGNSLVSTINLDIQKAIEKRRKEFDEETGSKMTTITVMNPNNGEILGMTSSYDFDPNDPTDEEVLKQLYSSAEIAEFKKNDEKINNGEKLEREKPGDVLTTIDALSTIWKNSVISDTFEPGSTFKPFTVAASLEEDLYDGDEWFYCPGYYTVNKSQIGCSHKHNDIAFPDIIAQSCNTALMTIGLEEGNKTFTEYQSIFGFGQKTGIDLPGEPDTSTLVYDPDNMKELDLATNSFGQNFNVTGIQLVSAFCSLINGGYYYEPHVVKQIVSEDGNVIENIEKTVKKTTISSEVSEILKDMLHETTISGTAKAAAIEGYTVGGKTGTAEKLTPVEKDGKTYYIRNKQDYLVSFIGFTPVEDAEVVIYVTIDEPNVDYQANSGLATRLEQKCMKDIIKILDIEKTETE